MSSNLIPYEVVIILNPDSSEDIQKQLFRKNKEIIEAHGGTVNSVDTWGRRPLANMIEKARKGIYFHATFMADNKAVAELERTMGINEHVLRFMHSRLPVDTNLPTFMENFKASLAEGVAREKDREIKMQQKRAARMAQSNT
jgi:small subunit ribosomal protein S6